MGLAFQMILSGTAPVMVTGGSEAMLCFGGMKAWEGLRVMSEEACRPFSANRSGMVQGEGAGIFVFEEWESARNRGADILAEVVGFAMTSDASDIVLPCQAGAERAMKGALDSAGLNADEVDYINAHGTGTKANDKTECAAINGTFAEHSKNLMVSSTKSMHGHLIGATGAVELLACVMALRHGVVAPTIGYEQPDPECALDVVPNAARQAKVGAALSNAFGFGGGNAVIALKKA
jgi:nodulation protein E